MMSLFSSFDSSLYSMNFFIVLMFSCMLILFSSFFSSTMKIIWESVYALASEFFLSLKNNSLNKSIFLFIFSVLSAMILINFCSVTGYKFPVTSQVSLVMYSGLCLWAASTFASVFMNPKGFSSHLVPEGTPIYLTFLLFSIEMVSNLIRPITLTVRLVANIVAGHLLMILLSELVLKFYLLGFSFFLLNTVEIGVSLIQSYIFVTMVSLYYSDL